METLIYILTGIIIVESIAIMVLFFKLATMYEDFKHKLYMERSKNVINGVRNGRRSPR